MGETKGLTHQEIVDQIREVREAGIAEDRARREIREQSLDSLREACGRIGHIFGKSIFSFAGMKEGRNCLVCGRRDD